AEFARQERVVGYERGPQRQASGMLIALILVVSSLTGLMAGVMTRHVTIASATTAPQATSTEQHLCSAQFTVATGVGSAAPSTVTPYNLTVTLTPNRIRTCEPFQIVVNASSNNGSGPVAGVRCTLVAPEGGAPSILDGTGGSAPSQFTQVTD